MKPPTKKRAGEESERFKQAVVAGVQADRPVKAIAAELGVTEASLYMALRRMGWKTMILSATERWVITDARRRELNRCVNLTKYLDLPRKGRKSA